MENFNRALKSSRVILISNKVDIKARNIARYEKKHLMMRENPRGRCSNYKCVCTLN